jgi:hypothetical protein
MRLIPNVFWVPAPFSSAWDFLRSDGIFGTGRPPPDAETVSPATLQHNAEAPPKWSVSEWLV